MRSFYTLGYAVYSIFAVCFSAIADFASAVLRINHGSAWHSLRDLGINAYRKIADMKPVYRDSYATHGLSLSDG